MGTRANRSARRLYIGAVITTILLLFGTACETSDTEVPGGVEARTETDAGTDDVVELEPAPFELPDDCEALMEFAAEARDDYDESEVGTQELIDAKARFDGAINEQMLLGCG